MSFIQDPAAAQKYMRTAFDALRHVIDLYGEADEGSDEDAGNRDIESEIVDRVVEDAEEHGINPDDTEKLFKLILAYCKKASE